MSAGFFTIGLLQTFAVILPGPDFAMVVKNTLSWTRRAGYFTALGITCGILFHMTYCLLGLAIIITSSSLLFKLIQYSGCIYLIYMGLHCLFAKRNAFEKQEVGTVCAEIKISDTRAFKQGLYCNILNPKASLFFLGLFTLVVHPDTRKLLQLSYCAEIAVITFSWFCFLTWLLSHQKISFYLHRCQQTVTKLMGIFLIFFAVRLALFTH